MNFWVLATSAVLLVTAAVSAVFICASLIIGLSVTGYATGVAVITGDKNVGVQSDMELSRQKRFHSFTATDNNLSWYSCSDCNVLIITIDTLRADHLSSYGYSEDTSPVLDFFSEDGITFTNAFSQIPFTEPSHWSIFTGLYPHNHNTVGWYIGGNVSGLVTISDVLEENGYVTGGLISAKILDGFGEKFEYFNNYTVIENESDVNGFSRFTRQADKITPVALSWLDEHSGEKFLLWIHYWDPHKPYDPPREYDLFNYDGSGPYSDKKYNVTVNSEFSLYNRANRTIREEVAKYDGEIRFTDEQVGLVLDKLNELGIDGSTLVIILSDHGECFGEHMLSDFGYLDESPCTFHGNTLYDEEIHIPLIIRNPMSPTDGIKVNDLVETVDLFPTILETLGLGNEVETDGESLIPLINGSGRKKDYAISQTRQGGNFPEAMSIRTDQWKFVVTTPIKNNDTGDLYIVAKKMLFDVREGESINMIMNNTEVARELEDRLINIFLAADWPETSEIENEDIEEMLRSLGYMV